MRRGACVATAAPAWVRARAGMMKDAHCKTEMGQNDASMAALAAR